jgi:hypothetical protein
MNLKTLPLFVGVMWVFALLLTVMVASPAVAQGVTAKNKLPENAHAGSYGDG